MKRVLVLCTGNSCRSQMAEGYLEFYVQGKAEVFSAGLENHGVNPFALRAMAEDNIDISSHYAKTVDAFRNEHFDYLVTVCDEASQERFRGISYTHRLHFSIPDPAAFTGSEDEIMEEFRRVRELVKKYMLKFIGQALLENAVPAV
ncbi:MAG: arsenate reductase ArsC [Phaeodactylibacter sp.]|nr:arsenate reductase ArsC [Phaeodactylibacter sp.]MCB9274745.1 arsenate reductase ArsC [Lewinellaceae bacterium]